MIDSVHAIDSADQIRCAAQHLREVAHEAPADLEQILGALDRWGQSLDSGQAHEIPGMPFLRLWLRRSTLTTLLIRELGSEALDGSWREDGRSEIRSFPLGVIGHWPAGNIEIQPILSLTCALLGGNSCLVRVPTRLVDATRFAMEKLSEVSDRQAVTSRIFMASFDHSRGDLHEAMAREVDGAMIWGDAGSVSYVRGLSFPHWARVLIFGPRYSIAAMDEQAWSHPAQRLLWCRRIARDVWQFDQKACTSPQVLLIEGGTKNQIADFMGTLKEAFEDENKAHARRQIEPALTSAICQARSSWLLSSTENNALFPTSPDWTILQGAGVKTSNATQGRTLTVLTVDDLFDAISGFDGSIQTLGLAMSDPAREQAVAEAAARRGVDRIVKIGQMHVFGSPWDGTDLVRPLVRLVRHGPSLEINTERQNGRCTALSGSVGS